MSPADEVAPTVVVDVEVDGARVDVRVQEGRIAAVGPGLGRGGAVVVDGGGGALVPGLHDHHLHLLAMAAARRSVDLGGVADAAGLDAALRAADGAAIADGWVRAVGLDARHGPLDRDRLDALAPGRPVRVQHRSGAAWVVSTAGLDRLGIASADGWLHRVDDALAARWAGPDDEPDLGPVGARLARRGVTGVTDATPFGDPGGFALLAAARAGGVLPQHVTVTGGPALAADRPPAGLARGPVKVVVADDALPSPDDLVAAFRAARRAGRAVAVHCVTRVGLALALAAWDEVGTVDGDRVEHGSVVPVEVVATLAERGLRVVTQPGFVAARGDTYLDEVDPDDVPHLYRCRTLRAGGVRVAGSTDAPFGPDDPWVAVAAAVDRRAPSGRPVGPDEAVAPTTALDLFLSPLADPGGPPRRVAVGAPADLVLLDAPLATVLASPSAAHVARTWIAGRPTFG